MFTLAALAGYSIGQMAVAIIIIAAVCAIVFVIVKAMGVTIPAFVLQCAWILVLAVVGIFCIRLLLSL